MGLSTEEPPHAQERQQPVAAARDVPGVRAGLVPPVAERVVLGALEHLDRQEAAPDAVLHGAVEGERRQAAEAEEDEHAPRAQVEEDVEAERDGVDEAGADVDDGRQPHQEPGQRGAPVAHLAAGLGHAQQAERAEDGGGRRCVVVDRGGIGEEERAAEGEDGDEVRHARPLDQVPGLAAEGVERARARPADDDPRQKHQRQRGARAREREAQAEGVEQRGDGGQDQREHGRLGRIEVAVPLVVDHVDEVVDGVAVGIDDKLRLRGVVDVEVAAQGQALDGDQARDVVLALGDAVCEEQQHGGDGEGEAGGAAEDGASLVVHRSARA